MKLLLHICCGPCLIYPFKVLKDNNFELKGLFYNPNIQPGNEFNLRKKSLIPYSKKINLEIIEPEYNSDEFSNCASFNQGKPCLWQDREKRCSLCWQLRLKKTAQMAKELNFDFFTTTLLVSPYQNHNKLKEIGQIIAKTIGVEFFYYDFREGFMGSRIIAKENNLYLQKYCGCLNSKEERKANAAIRV